MTQLFVVEEIKTQSSLSETTWLGTLQVLGLVPCILLKRKGIRPLLTSRRSES